MRRRPIILLLCATAALVGAAVALADPPGTGPAVRAFGETPDAQVGPSVAVNPAGGSPNILAAIMGTDWSNPAGPQSILSTGSIVATSGATTWNSTVTLPHAPAPGGDYSLGSPDVVWGPGNKLYAVEVTRDSDDRTNPCLAGAGIYLYVSTDAGVSWRPEIELAFNGPGQANTDPSIAFDPSSGRIYVSYTRTDPCTGTPGDGSSTSQVRLVTLSRDDGTGFIPITPVGDPAASHDERSSVVALPNGSVGIAYYDSTTNPGAVRFSTCTPPTGSPPSPVCAAPVTIDGSASDPNSPALPGVQVRPTVAADSTGRVVVTWSELTDAGSMDVFSATSRDSGATFGPPQQVPANGGSTNQINPAVAIAPDGRADVVFLDSGYNPAGYEVAASASSRPSGGGTVESWSQSVPVESAPIVPVASHVPGGKSIGDRLGIAEVPRASGPYWTLIAWTDSRNVTGGMPLNDDVYSTVLMHGTTAPTASDMTATVQRNVPTTVNIVGATDADADPLTYSILQNGTQGTAVIPDAIRPQLTYNAPDSLGTDTVRIGISDGQHQTSMTVTLQIVNSPPVITCTRLSTPVNTPLAIPATCVSDANNDPLSITASTPMHGHIDGLSFIPDTGYEGDAAQVTLTASDGIETVTQTIRITVGAAGQSGVAIAGEAARAAYTDRPITFEASPTVASADATKIQWSFDGGTTDSGKTVSHLFPNVGKFQVTAKIGDGPPATVSVYVQKPPLTITSTSLGRNGLMGMRVKLANKGKLTAGLLGVHGVHQRTMKLTKGMHTLHMQLPPSARTRGTVIVKLKLALPSGGTTTLHRAVLVPGS
jgi:hypothetical protein